MDDENIRHIKRRGSMDRFLDDLMDNLNELGFGRPRQRRNRGNGRDDGGGGSSNDKGIMPILMIALAVAVLYGAFSSFYTIQPHQRGVITRFGQYVRTVDNGLHFMIPFGVDNVTKVEISSQPMTFGYQERTLDRRMLRSGKNRINKESLMLTGDLNVAEVEWKVEYRVSDPRLFLFSARDPLRNIKDLSLSIMRRVVGNRSVSSVLTTDRIGIAVEAKELTQELLDKYNLGVTIVTLKLQGVNPPDEVKPAFNEVNEAKQEQEETINNAEKEYNRVIPEARGKAEQQIADAEGYAVSVLNKAKGASERFRSVYESYRRSPTVTRKRLYLETVEEIMSSLSQVTIVDSNLRGILPLYQNPSQLQSFLNQDNRESEEQGGRR